MKRSLRVCVLFVVLAVMTSAALAGEVKVNWDYATSGIDEGSGLWSITIDSNQIPNPEFDPNDPNSAPYLEGGDNVTFMAAMAKPVVTQRDALLEGDVIPEIPGLVGWTNDASDKGRTTGVSWTFYEADEIVTLRSITDGYLEFSFDIATQMRCPDKEQDELCTDYRYAFSFTDNAAGLDVVDEYMQAVGYFGDVEHTVWDEDSETEEYGQGHRHSGGKFRNENQLVEGQDVVCRIARDGAVDEMADGDGIGVSLGFRKMHDDDAPSNASVFLFDVMIGGNVFADTDTIYAEDIKQD